MSSKTVWGTLATVVLAAGAVVACSGGTVAPGILGNDPNADIPGDDGVPSDGTGVPAGDDATPDRNGGGGGATGAGRKLINVLNGCDTNASSACSDAELDSWVSCVSSSCGDTFLTCFGDIASSGSFGGSCGTIFSCIDACGCDGDCAKSCAANADPSELSACSACTDAKLSCADSCNKPTCFKSDDDGDDDGDNDTTTIGPSCAELQTCCATVDASIQNACNQVASSGQEAQCASTLSQLQENSLCP